MSEEEEEKRFHEHDQNLLSVVRERVLDECFGVASTAAGHANEALRTCGVSVLTALCGRVAHMPEAMYSAVFARMKELRQRAIDDNDVVTYEEIVTSMVAMGRNDRLGKKAVHMKDADDVFNQLWLYHHLLGKDLGVATKSPFWAKVVDILTPETLKIIKDSENTNASQAATQKAFTSHKTVRQFFNPKLAKEREEEEKEEEYVDPDAIRYGVDLKPTTRKKINEGVKKAIRLAHILGIHAEDEERKKEERKKLVGPQVADKADHDKEMDQLLRHM